MTWTGRTRPFAALRSGPKGMDAGRVDQFRFSCGCRRLEDQCAGFAVQGGLSPIHFEIRHVSNGSGCVVVKLMARVRHHHAQGVVGQSCGQKRPAHRAAGESTPAVVAPTPVVVVAGALPTAVIFTAPVVPVAVPVLVRVLAGGSVACNQPLVAAVLAVVDPIRAGVAVLVHRGATVALVGLAVAAG